MSNRMRRSRGVGIVAGVLGCGADAPATWSETRTQALQGPERVATLRLDVDATERLAHVEGDRSVYRRSGRCRLVIGRSRWGARNPGQFAAPGSRRARGVARSPRCGTLGACRETR